MEYRLLGRTGLKVSALCLGTMTFGWSADEPTAFSIMDFALESGINFFDTANIYPNWVEGNVGGESEIMIGNWLKERKNRREVIIATKVRGEMWRGSTGEGLNRVHIMQAVEDSLRRLQTDYIDLYQAHWPDDATPLDETLAAFDALVQSGKVRYIGASNYRAWLLVKSLWVSDVKRLVRFESLQPHYSMLHREEFERELLDACRDQQIGVIPYSPLAAGFLTGKYTRENRQPDSTRSKSGTIQSFINNDAAYDALDVIRGVAEAHNAPMAQIALAWMLANPVITAPIFGARKVDQLREVVGAVDVKLSADEIAALNKATEPFAFVREED